MLLYSKKTIFCVFNIVHARNTIFDNFWIPPTVYNANIHSGFMLSPAMNMWNILCFSGWGSQGEQPPASGNIILYIKLFIFYLVISLVPFMPSPTIRARNVGFGELPRKGPAIPSASSDLSDAPVPEWGLGGSNLPGGGVLQGHSPLH